MPYKLIPPSADRRTPYFSVRGSEHGIPLNRSTQTADRREAQAILKRWRAEAKRRSVLAPEEPSLTFGKIALSYIQANHSQRFLEPIVRHFRETPIEAIGQAEIDAAAIALYPNATPATRNRQVYSPVSAILRHAGVVIVLKRPQGAHGGRRVQWLRPEQAFAFLAAAKGLHERFGALLTFLLYCGPRLSEALRLEWSDIDFERALATIGKTKNGDPLTVHMNPEVVATLANLPRDKAKVFCLTKSGRLYLLWAETERRAGLALPPRSAFHILRHTHATWRRLYAGADTAALVATGLWKSRTSAARYEHVDAADESRKADLLPMQRR